MGIVTNNRSFQSRAAIARALALAGLLASGAPVRSQILGKPTPGAAPAAGALDYRDPAQAPPSWAQFAKLVKYRFETWMAADEAVANRFRAYVIEHSGKNDGVPPALVLKAWLNPDGSVEKVSFPSLNDPHADDDLRTILKRGNVGEAPPPEMLQPLNLKFSLNLKK
jgi:hypothetical protein